MPTPPRLVLDTNACLDLFVFAAPEVALLHAALQRGEVIAITSAECRDEWLRVLRYPVLRLETPAIDAAVAAHDALVRCVDLGLGPPSSGASEAQALVAARYGIPTHPAGPVPRCADPDDQKFLQLAHACGARWLLSRDKAVLALARRARRAGLFHIIEPAAWRPDL